MSVTVSGADFLLHSRHFSGEVVSANAIRFEIAGFSSPWDGDFFEVAEDVAGVGTVYLTAFSIRATTDISGRRMSGAFSQGDGWLGLAGAAGWICPISSFELTRQ